MWQLGPVHTSAEASAFKEYRYDTLGRQILSRSRSEDCNAYNCPNAFTRTVWDGEQLLYEIC